MKSYHYTFVAFLTGAMVSLLPSAAVALSCVWKATDPNGDTLYLGGSIHALRSTDYPLPAAYNRAFDACSRIVFEVNPKDIDGIGRSFSKVGEYPNRDTIRNHVDPRTYNYLCRYFALLSVPEDKFVRLRPWYLAALLQAPQLHGLSRNLGVEGFLEKRARTNAKSVSGLESLPESIQIFSGLSDRQSEAFLLLTFIPVDHESSKDGNVLTAWRHGDVEAIANFDRAAFHDVPSLRERFIDMRNRKWMPKIEDYLRSGKTYFVVVGAGHMGGPSGLLAMLRARGYSIEQL